MRSGSGIAPSVNGVASMMVPPAPPPLMVRDLPMPPERMSRSWMPVTGAVAVAVLVSDRYRGFALVVGFILVMQLQMLGGNKPPVSPWRSAADAMQAGREGKARRILVSALSQPRPDRRPAPLDLNREEAEGLVSVLPEPLPSGDPLNEYLLASLLVGVGRHEDAAHYAADSYHRHPNALVAGKKIPK